MSNGFSIMTSISRRGSRLSGVSIAEMTITGISLRCESARTARLKVQTEALAQRVNLHLALGGAFDDLPAVPVAAR